MGSSVRVWDPFVRVFHWSLVTLFVVAWITADEWDRAHEIAGYVIGVLVGLRLIWGFVGPRHARFSDFVRRPSEVVGYLRGSIRRRSARYIGHNPAGGAMVLALLVVLIGIVSTGIMQTMDAFWGVKWVEETHEVLANLSLALVVVHVGGVLFASLEHGENLVKSMVTGRKRAEASGPR